LFAFGKIIAYYMGMNSESVKQTDNRPKRKAPKTAFKPGQSGNPNGRPKKGFAVAEMIEAKVSDDDWAEILAKAVEQAKAGDKGARDYLTNRKDGLAIATQKIAITELEPLTGIVIE